MKNFVVVLLIIMISVVTSKPIEEQQIHSGSGYNPNSKAKRQLPDEMTLSKQFFDNVFEATRISRDTNDADAVPTIALHDLISSVEHTLIHSAQNLAAYNLTAANLTTTVSENDNTTSNTNNTNVSNIQQIVLPITIPTPSPTTNDEIVTEAVEEEEEDDHSDAPVTEETKIVSQPNITILQTLNSSQVIPTQTDVVHFHQQQITLFSADAGVFPNIHAIHAQDFPVLAPTVPAQPEAESQQDCSGEETSDESSDDDEESTSSSEEEFSSSNSSEEKEKIKKTVCTLHKSSVATSKTVESTTSSETIIKMKTDELKEKIAEVEADPVILTQGI